MLDITTLYCSVDDFFKIFQTEWEKHLIEKQDRKKRGPSSKLSTRIKSTSSPLLVRQKESYYRPV